MIYVRGIMLRFRREETGGRFLWRAQTQVNSKLRGAKHGKLAGWEGGDFLAPWGLTWYPAPAARLPPLGNVCPDPRQKRHPRLHTCPAKVGR